jgi:hypothetical protein
VALVTLALFWFSLGGWFTTLTYYCFPMMKKYRFVSAVWNFLRVFALLLGGFGFEQILRDLRGRPAPQPAVFSKRARWVILVVLALCALDHWENSGGRQFFTSTDFIFQGKTWPELFARQSAEIKLGDFEIGNQGLLMIRYLLYAAGLGLSWLLLSLNRPPASSERSRTKAMGPLLLAVYLADVGFFYSQVLKQAPWCPLETPPGDALIVHEMIYRPHRYQIGNLPTDAAKVLEIIVCKRGGSPEQNPYASSGVLMQCDLAVNVAADFRPDEPPPAQLPMLRLDLMMPSIRKMIEARAGPKEALAPINRAGWYEPALRALFRDGAFRRSVGAGRDKARMIHDRNVVFADSEEVALAVFRQLANPDEKIVIQGTRPVVPGEGSDSPGNVEEKRFSPNRVVFQVPAGAAGWLFYADAYDPGWKAVVDGQPTEVYRANVGFKAVHVPQSAREVTFFYDGGLRDLHGLAFVAASALLAFALTGLLVFAPWLVPIGHEVEPAPDADTTHLDMVRTWSALAWLAALAGGLFLFADFFCLSLVIVLLAALAVFLVHNRTRSKA